MHLVHAPATMAALWICQLLAVAAGSSGGGRRRALWIFPLLAAAAVVADPATCSDADGASSSCASGDDFLDPTVRQWIEDLPTERSLYLDGAWVQPTSDLSCPDDNSIDVVDPSTGETIAQVAVSNKLDVDMAVSSARRALEEWSTETELQMRRYHVSRLLMQYSNHADQMAQLISHEMGAPIDFASDAQVDAGIDVIQNFLGLVGEEGEFQDVYQPDEEEDTIIMHQAIGVVALITPWNWPMHQIILKVVPALLVGCTIVLKPSEESPLSALLFGQLIDRAGFPPGVFQLVNGYGPNHVGEWLASHPDVDMVSFTGSTRGGKQVSLAAAPTLKRVSLEMGGKGANIIFDDLIDGDGDLSDFWETVQTGVWNVMSNSGQSCDAPTRMLVPEDYYDVALKAAGEAAALIGVGSAHVNGEHIGPVVSEAQYERIQSLIQSGIDEGARLVAGGLGKPAVDDSGSPELEHFESGFYVRPTIFADCIPEMRVFQEEIFGPVLCITKFASTDEAIDLANNSPYGLTHYAHTYDRQRRIQLAIKLKSGMIVMNGVELSAGSPFGGVKQSGNSREGGLEGLKDFCNIKAVSGLKGDDEDSEDEEEVDSEGDAEDSEDDEEGLDAAEED
ncbi:hypothetical protein ACHAXT_006058 [Thalassiosira profunda]